MLAQLIAPVKTWERKFEEPCVPACDVAGILAMNLPFCSSKTG
jgi:hypothetical protein